MSGPVADGHGPSPFAHLTLCIIEALPRNGTAGVTRCRKVSGPYSRRWTAGLPKGEVEPDSVGPHVTVVSPSSRKRTPRRALRLPVKFWRAGEARDQHSGYSLNVSRGGMFVATHRPYPPSAFVELEFEHEGHSINTLAQVAHAARYPTEFQSVRKSGMGLRFYAPNDPAIVQLAGQGQLLHDRGGRRRS